MIVVSVQERMRKTRESSKAQIRASQFSSVNPSESSLYILSRSNLK